MRITSKGRYAVTAMLDIAIHQADGMVSVKEIARRQNISEPYLEQLLGSLRKSGMLLSQRGPGGGYALTDSPSNIGVSSVLEAVGEGVDVTRCAGSGDCNNGHMCLTHNLWASLSHQIDNFLSRVTLDELFAKKNEDVGEGILDQLDRSLIQVNRLV